MLRIEAEQRAEDGPGWCRLRIHGLERHSSAVELMIRRPGASRIYLGPGDWQDSEAWLPFSAEPDEGGAVRVRLGPPHTLRLGNATTVEMRVRIPGGADGRTRLAWPRLVLPAENDAVSTAAGAAEPSDASQLAPAPPPAVSPPPSKSADGAASEPLTAGPLMATPAGRGTAVTTWAGLSIAGVLFAVALLSLFMAWRSEPEPAAPAPAAVRAFTEESVRAFLAAEPDGPSATAEAALYAAAGHPGLALLLYRHAARRGEPEAALAIGRMYDPEGFDPSRSAFAVPDADQAASFYEQAAEKGDAEAQLRLGVLLLSGRSSGETDAERGALWLQRAAAQGNAGAQAALAKLGKTP